MASSSSNECGIDCGLFRGKLLDMMLCNLCHLVLNEPVQLSGCRHLFCNPCFQRYQKVSSKGKRELLCPVDQKVVAFSQIQPDEETKEFIDNLGVVCPNKARGCAWEGLYEEMNAHLTKCERKDKVDEVLEKMDKMDQKMLQREKEYNQLKNNNEIVLGHQLRAQLRKQKDNIESVKLENEGLKVEIHELKIKTEDENEELKLKVDELEKNTAKNEEEITSLKKENTDLKAELNTLKTGLGLTTRKEEQVTSQPKEITNNTPPSQVYFDLMIDNKSVGRIIINLFHKESPNNCKKMVQLCTHEPGWGYEGVTVSKLSDTWLSLGKSLWTDTSSKGYRSVDFKTKPEHSTASNNRKGLVSFDTDNGYTHTELIIISKSCPENDANFTIIGEITSETWKVVEKIWEVPRPPYCGKPYKEIKITACGVMG